MKCRRIASKKGSIKNSKDLALCSLASSAYFDAGMEFEQLIKSLNPKKIRQKSKV